MLPTRLQYISYYHPVDYIQNLASAYEREESPAAKDAIAQILINSRLCAEGHRPICQDTGIVTVFLKIGMNVTWPDATMGVEDMCNEGVRRAYNHPNNKLRASVLADPAFGRKNTKDNTPAVINVSIVPGNEVDVTVAAKGGGSEAKSKFAMLNPSDSIVEWVLKTVPTMGAGWCPPGMLGIGIGGTAEKAMLLAKESLMEPIDMPQLKARKAAGEALTKIDEPAHRAVRQGQCARDRCPGSRRPDHRARRQDLRLPDPRGKPAGGDHSELRGDPSRPLRPRWLRSGRARSAVARRLAEADLLAGRRPPREPGHRDPRGSGDVEAGRSDPAERQAADRPRRRPQAHDRHAVEGREAAGRLHQPLHLLRRPGRPGAR